MRLSTIVIVPVIASAACAIPVENVPLGQGDSSLASSEGETSQVLPGTLYPRWGWPSISWKTNGQSTVSNGPQSTVSTVPKIIQNCQFRRHREGARYETDNSETVKDQRADDFSHWIVESAVAKFCSKVSEPEGQRIEFTVGDKPGLPFVVHGVPELGTVEFKTMLYRKKDGGRMSIEAFRGEDRKRLLNDLISGWEEKLNAQELSEFTTAHPMS
ncbi:hypothetical protein F5880DRAFT_1512315 [Lentinula raphanica]|nr:hypothetical protein F5880DRAFT_1512315 [Lentinula raphanica]